MLEAHRRYFEGSPVGLRLKQIPFENRSLKARSGAAGNEVAPRASNLRFTSVCVVRVR